jgi:flagellar L-ring protein precursor FlgH
MNSNTSEWETRLHVMRNSKLETGKSKTGNRAANFEFRFSSFLFPLLLVVTICLFAVPGYGMGFKRKGQTTKDYLADYIQRVKAVKPATPTTGSVWTPQSPFSDMASDYKARNVNDLIVIEVVESTTAAEDGLVKTARTFTANSGISALAGNLGANNSLQNLFSPSSSRTLNGQSQTSSDASLSTNLSGRVVEVLPNGFLVIEAERQMFMNNQHQTVIIHGVVRPGDIGPTNAVASTSISNLEVELKGRGVVSDGVAPPNKLVRLILKLVGF